jgi:amino acid transporter
LINAVYAFSGVESLAIAAAETKNPRRNVPRAAKHVFVRVFVFYLVSLFVVGLIVPSNDEHLLKSTGTAASSPFVIAATRAGVKVLPSIINAIIVTSAWSSGNHAMLVGSRSLYALALDKKAPKIFARVSRYGIPWVAVLFVGAFQFLSFMSLNSGAATVFSWITNLNSSCTLCIWMCIGYNSLRTRQAMKVQGIEPSQLPWSAPFQPYISYITICGSSLILLTGGFYSFVSIPDQTRDQADTASSLANGISPISSQTTLPSSSWSSSTLDGSS